MIDLIDNGKLINDLDAAGFDLLNVSEFLPVPTGLVGTTDPRLSDARVPLGESVTNAKVASNAAISQSKLNLNGEIPTAWLGTTSTTVARGDLAEYLSRKGQPLGYPPLDGTGKIPSGFLPDTIGVGTITSIGLTMPTGEFDVTGSPVTTNGTLAVAWKAIANGTWFGNDTGGAAAPQFRTTPLPATLIPDLDASKITSGVLAAARLPVAVGVGGSHAIGAVPDPGASGTADDYLARDMTYKTKPAIGVPYQPVVPNPSFLEMSGGPGFSNVTITNTLDKVSLFFSTTSASTGFQPYVSPVNLATGSTVWAYGARLGYNNSSVASFTA